MKDGKKNRRCAGDGQADCAAAGVRDSGASKDSRIPDPTAGLNRPLVLVPCRNADHILLVSQARHILKNHYRLILLYPSMKNGGYDFDFYRDCQIITKPGLLCEADERHCKLNNIRSTTVKQLKHDISRAASKSYRSVMRYVGAGSDADSTIDLGAINGTAGVQAKESRCLTKTDTLWVIGHLLDLVASKANHAASDSVFVAHGLDIKTGLGYSLTIYRRGR